MTKHFSLTIQTQQQFEILDITSQVSKQVTEAGLIIGMVTVSTPHTTASIRLNHYEPLLMQDITAMLYRLAPQDISYNHDQFELRQHVVPTERSNGHAHVKAFLLGSSQSVPLVGGTLLLGDRQSILFVECDGSRSRTVHVTIVGDV